MYYTQKDLENHAKIMLECRFFVIRIKKSRKDLFKSIIFDHLIVNKADQRVGRNDQP